VTVRQDPEGVKPNRRGGSELGIREVAERAQVSIATVSQVLNGKGSFSPQTKERVLEAAAELGYRPNPTAAALGAGRAGGRLGVIGLAMSYGFEITFSLTDTDYFKKLIESAVQQALARGYALVVGPPTSQTKVWLGLPLDGVIVVDPVLDDAVPATLRGRRTPLVIAGRDAAGPDDVRVYNDADAVVGSALDHFTEAGSARPALFAYPVPDMWVGDLCSAFDTQCKERGLEPVTIMLDWERTETFNEWLGDLLTSPDAPDAVLCTEDDLATSLEAGAAERGVSVPEQLQIIAISDRSDFPGIAFTTVEIDPDRTGRVAVDVLIDLVENKDTARLTEIPVRLVPRESTRHA
jgi:DNA-binding LacI/PurR family transcriptional regulator